MRKKQQNLKFNQLLYHANTTTCDCYTVYDELFSARDFMFNTTRTLMLQTLLTGA